MDVGFLNPVKTFVSPVIGNYLAAKKSGPPEHAQHDSDSALSDDDDEDNDAPISMTDVPSSVPPP
jgi:hypothetical protein